MISSLQKVLFLAGALALLLLVGAVDAQGQKEHKRPVVLVKSKVEVQHERVTLGDIATVHSTDENYSKFVEALRAIDLGEAPPPKTQRQILGVKILDVIREAGFSIDDFGYSIPKTVLVLRKGHVLKEAEVLEVARRALNADRSFDLQVRSVRWSHAHVIPVGKTNIQVKRLGEPNAGKVPLRVDVSVDDLPAAKFLATAEVDDWREVPVLTRDLNRGTLITSDDLHLVRLNLHKQPRDVIWELSELIGRRVKSQLEAGNTVRAKLVDIPPVISKGKEVTAIYQSGGITVTTTVVAMEDGFRDKLIRVKNLSSRAVLRARVVSAEEVEVQGK